MNSDKRASVPYLRLVSSGGLESAISGAFTDYQQASLFPSGTEHLLVFTTLGSFAQPELLRLLDAVAPTAAVDLRILPRFDFGGLNRKTVLKEFETRRITYWDMSPLISSKYKRAEEIEASIVVDEIASLLGGGVLLSGPILVFIPPECVATGLAYELARLWPSGTGGGWDLCILPALKNSRMDVPESSQEPVLFISHANPEDNEFVMWLSANLERLGYNVWLDLRSLNTGEVFWDRIEDTIRHCASKVIAVVSRASQKKPGVLDELNLALTVERVKGISNFVMPVILDDLPFAEVRANIARRSITNFSRSWANGLHALVSALEADRVDRRPSDGPRQLLESWRSSARGASMMTRTPEALSSNWLGIASLPPTLFIYEPGLKDSGGAALVECVAPLAGAYRCTFTRVAATTGFVLRAEIATRDFLRGNPGGFIRVPWNEARNAVASLIRQHWNAHCLHSGLLPYQLSGRRQAWFFPFNAENQTATTTDVLGHRRRRALCGKSERRSVYWHFAMEAKVSLEEPSRLSILEHVVFTTDGVNPLASKAQSHRLRRSFCKNWWNDRWRDLLAIGIARLTNRLGNEPVVLGSGGPSIWPLPVSFESPVSLLESANDEVENADVDMADAIEELEIADEWEEPIEIEEEIESGHVGAT